MPYHLMIWGKERDGGRYLFLSDWKEHDRCCSL